MPVRDQESRTGSQDLSVAIDLIQTVTGDTFRKQVIEADHPVAVEFMSYGCAHCRAIEPALQRIAEIDNSEVVLCRVNTAVDPNLASSFEIHGTPTLIMFLNGAEVGRVVGPSPTVSSVQAAMQEAFAQ